MPFYISAEVGSSFFSAFNVFLSQLGDVLNSLFHISIGGVSIGIIWISLSIMLTIIALTINVIRNGAENTAFTSTRDRVWTRRDAVYKRNNPRPKTSYDLSKVSYEVPVYKPKKR